MNFERGSGILMHITSLPGDYGIGDFGKEAYKFVDFLSLAKQKYWQILPLTPTNSSNSPYESLSAFAGNPLFICPEKLYQIGHLVKSDIENVPKFSKTRVNYKSVIKYKSNLLLKAYHNFKQKTFPDHYDNFMNFCNEHSYWLNDYSLYIALKKAQRLVTWSEWEPALASREPETIARWRKKLADEIEYQKYQQWQFLEQWLAIKNYANERNIKIIGDIPIFVSMDSADVWSNQDLFYLDQNLKPIFVSGVPPDYFSSTGQKWGHPLYRWNIMAEDRYDWWTKRFQIELLKEDILRIDHFRAFYNYWEIPGDAELAIKGQWVRGPDAEFFHTIISRLRDIAIIAEDLGDFDQESRAGVDKLKEKFGFPGMTLLQFAFNSDTKNIFLPHNYTSNNVAYTGTHDNDTIKGWYEVTSTKEERKYVLDYLATDGSDISWDLIRLAWSSIAKIAMTTAQDLLKLGHESRINTPSTVGPANWSWRLSPGVLTDEIITRLRRLTEIFGRD